MYLWLDLWDKRCGIAIFLENIIIPKEIVPREKIVKILQKYISDYKIEVLVVGLPFDLYGKKLKQLEKTKKFIEKLKNIFPDLKIEEIDERFSTFEAENILDFLWEKEKFWKKDAISASIILETYLKKEKIYL